MKLTIQSTTLLSAITRAKPAVPNGMFAVFLLTAKDNALTVTANNFDQSISATAECVTETDGATVINAGRLSEVVAALGKCEISLESDGKLLTILRGLSRITLAALKPEEFAPVAKIEGATEFTISQSEFRVELLRLIPFMCRDQTRYTLNSVYMSGDGETLDMVAVEGHMLRTARIESKAKCSAIIPSQAVKMLSSLCDEDSPVSLAASENMIEARGLNWHLVSKLVEGIFPNYKNTIPETVKAITGDRIALLEAMNLAELGARRAQGTTPITLSLDRDCSASAANSDGGNSDIPMDGWTTKTPVKIAFDPAFLRAGLKSFLADEIGLQIKSPGDTVKIEDSTGVFVVIPMRIS